MIAIEEFAQPDRHPFNTLESKMACAYRKAVEDLESASRDLWKTIRTERVDDRLILYFLPEYENPMLAMDYAERRLKEIQSDIENFMNILGSDSRRNAAEKLHRIKLDIANSKRQARNIRKQALNENPDLSSDEVENLQVVQAAFSKRDHLKTELDPIIDDFEDKIAKANEILMKYN